MPQIENKPCFRCGLVLTEANGYTRKSGQFIGQFHAYCRKCSSAYRAEYRARAPEKYRDQKRRHKETYLSNPRNLEKWKAYRSSPEARKAARATNRKILYGISQSDFDEMLKAQNNLCAICKVDFASLKRGPSVDHCHVTKKVRGLLCGLCNPALGSFRDSVELLSAAIQYINHHTNTKGIA